MSETNYYVYKHTSPNNKCYIGITCQNPSRRWRNGNGYSEQFFWKAICKYGWDNFTHEILYSGLTKNEAEQKEIELIKQYKSNDRRFGYNIDNGGKCSGRMSEQTKLKIHNAKVGKHISNETKRKLSKRFSGSGNPRYGVHLSDETKRKISEANKGKPVWNKGIPLSEEAKERLRQLSIGRPKKPDELEKLKMNAPNRREVLCIETNEVYSSTRDVERKLGICHAQISRCCRHIKGYETINGLHWKYIEEEV